MWPVPKGEESDMYSSRGSSGREAEWNHQITCWKDALKKIENREKS